VPTVIPDASDVTDVEADLLVVPVFKGGIEGPGAGAVLDALGMDAPPVTPSFRGDIGQTLTLASPGLPFAGVLFVGLGRMDATDDERLRRAAAIAGRAAAGVRRVATTLTQLHPTDSALQAVAEGFGLAAPRRTAKRDPGPAGVEEVVILTASSRLQRARTAIARAEAHVRATLVARGLVDLPPQAKRPPELAERITELISGVGEVRVLDERELAAQGFGGVLGVGRGASAPPRLVEACYRPDDPLGHVVLVGKGITFDTGGLSLKRGTAMDTMKSDMAGAAAVAGAFSALAELDIRLEVTAILPLAENMPGADAQRPGDVLRTFDGTTVEVNDTDAEGRLVLADGLALGVSRAPDVIIDLATLTGSVISALGPYAAGLMCTDEDLSVALLEAASAAGEPLWRLPLWDDLEPRLDSPVADVRNCPAPASEAGAIMGGLFLRRFVGGLPWAHLDIAGPAFQEAASPERAAGATGYGTRTLLSWLEQGH
jgi:leucyl aminopeptidase